jgi:hypothetical protein
MWYSLNLEDANKLVVEIITNCQGIALDRFLIKAMQNAVETADYVVYLEPYLGVSFKQEIRQILDNHRLGSKEKGNGLIVYSNVS